MWSQCLPYHGELDGGLAADSELVVPGGDASGLLQQADLAFGLVPALVHFAVETGWPAARRAPTETVSGLVPFLGMVCGICRRRRNSRISRDEYARSARTRAGRVRGCCPDPHTSYHATSIVQQANRTNLDYATPLCDEHVTDASSGQHEPDGTRFGHHFTVAHSSGRHSLSARRLSRIPMDARVLLVTARLQGIGYRALLAMAVGEVGGGGEGTVIELQKRANQGGPTQGREHAFAFPGLQRLQLTQRILI